MGFFWGGGDRTGFWRPVFNFKKKLGELSHFFGIMVKFPDGLFFDEVMSMEHRCSSTQCRKLTPSKGGYKWLHGGVYHMSFTEATYDGYQPS